MRNFPASLSEAQDKALTDHISKYIGEPANVLHEIASDTIHLDVHVVNPTKERPHWTLVTGGMSALAMNVPRGADICPYAELVITLPSSWKMDTKDFDNEKWYWPIFWLKSAARMPHENKSFLCEGHTVEFQEPTATVPFAGILLVGFAPHIPEDFRILKARERSVEFLTPIPLFKEELELVVNESANELFEKFDEIEEDWELYDVTRPNSCKRRR